MEIGGICKRKKKDGKQGESRENIDGFRSHGYGLHAAFTSLYVCLMVRGTSP